MLHVALRRLPNLEFNELQSEKYFIQNNSFQHNNNIQNQGFSPFQVTVIIKS